MHPGGVPADSFLFRTTKVFGGFISFIGAMLITLVTYNRKKIHLKVDDEFDEQVTILNVAVANGQYHGGGMWVAPDALMDDGLFNIIIIGDFSLPEVLWHLPKLYNGRLLTLEKIKSLTGRHIEARSDDEVLIDVDGEQPGRLPVAIDMVPKVLPFILPL